MCGLSFRYKSILEWHFVSARHIALSTMLSDAQETAVVETDEECCSGGEGMVSKLKAIVMNEASCKLAVDACAIITQQDNNEVGTCNVIVQHLLPLHQKNHVPGVMMNLTRMMEMKIIRILDLVHYCWCILENIHCKKLHVYTSMF